MCPCWVASPSSFNFKLTLADEGVVECTDDVALKLVAIVVGRHWVTAGVCTRRLEGRRETVFVCSLEAGARISIYHFDQKS